MLSEPLNLNLVPDEFRPFAEAIVRGPDSERRLIRLLGTLGEKVPKSSAEAFALLLRRTLPGSSYLLRVTDVFIRNTYPHWYIQAVTDESRNAAYASALSNLVTAESEVIEIGTGSGLFAMMAARCGAKHVYTFERNAIIARIAEENIARNGLSDRVTVLNADYLDASASREIPKGDLLLHEFVSGEFINSGIHKTIQQCRQRLLKPSAHILPQVLGTRGMLVGDQWMTDRVRITRPISGFDVSGLNLLSLHGTRLSGPVLVEKPMSVAQTLTDLDLCATTEISEGSTLVAFLATSEGTVHGLLQWVAQRFPDGSVYENNPERRCNWSPIFWPFCNPRSVEPGEKVLVRISHTQSELFVDDT